MEYRARPSRAPSVRVRPDVGERIDRALVVIAAWTLPIGAGGALAIGIRDADLALVALCGAALLVGLTAVAQLVTGRTNAIVLNVMTGAVLGIGGPFAGTTVSATLGTGLIVLTMAGTAQVPARLMRRYLGFMSGMWALHLLLRHFAGGAWGTGSALAYIAQVLFLAFGVPAMVLMRRQVAQSENRFAYLFDQAPVALWENDFSAVGEWLDRLRRDGVKDLRTYLLTHPDELMEGISLVVTTDANPEAAKVLAADSPDDLLGPFPAGIVDEDSRRIFLEQFVSIWEGTDTSDLSYTGIRFDGTTFDGLFHSISASGRDLSRLVTAVSDVTRLRTVEEELRSTETTSRALLDALPDLLFLLDADGTYLDFHVSGVGDRSRRSTESDLYVSPEEFLGKTPADILPPDLAVTMKIAIATALETNELQRFEYDLPIGGEDRHWEMRVAPLEGRSQVLALVRDQTEPNRARRELEDLIRSKDDFIAAISHELRTPLTGIVGFAHVLQDHPAMDPDEREQLITTLAAQSNDLTNIVEDLLVAAKADLGRLDFARVATDLRAQTNQVLEAWSPDPIAGVSVTGTGVVCRADPARVRQVVRNLLSNALRYGGSRISIEITTDGDRGVLTVTDDGPGIPDEQAEQVFRPYHRAAPADGLSAGLGIGLPIARTLAQRMHGDLTYEHIGSETRFRMTLPLLDSPADPVQRGSVGATAGRLGRNSPA
mgnify:CR=1 FL=1